MTSSSRASTGLSPLMRAVQEKLQKVVDIQDAETGTVHLKRAVDKLDEMALDTSSTKTTRVKP